MKYCVCLTLLAFHFINSSSQTFQITGQVVDSKTKEPLPFANIYINKTTIGTNTDDKGKFALQNIPLGISEIIISFIGYQSYPLKVTDKEIQTPMTIQLIPENQQLSEVEVKVGRDKVWEKKLRKFEKAFLGITNHCKILNPWVLEFSEDK